MSFLANGANDLSLAPDGSTITINFRSASGEVVPITLRRDIAWSLLGSIQHVCESAENAAGTPNANRGTWEELTMRRPMGVDVAQVPMVQPPSGVVVFDRGTPFQLAYQLTVPQLRQLAGMMLAKADSIDTASKTQN